MTPRTKRKRKPRKLRILFKGQKIDLVPLKNAKEARRLAKWAKQVAEWSEERK